MCRQRNPHGQLLPLCGLYNPSTGLVCSRRLGRCLHWQKKPAGPAVAMPASRTAPERPTSRRRSAHNSVLHARRDAEEFGFGAAKNRQKTIGGYVMGKVLGEGSFGKVRAGIHVVTGENVAIKILEKSRLNDATDVTRVVREIKILKRSRHQNVIQLFEVIESPMTICLIMENANAGEMFSYIVTHKRVGEPQACSFFHQIVDGVNYLHSMEVTHRDLKPENLLLQTSKKYGYIVKIIDFGLSNTHDGGKLLQTACGSPCYAAPEMIAGAHYCGPKADIWSMGVILFALISGYLPFEDSNTSVLYKKIMSGVYKTPPWISNDACDLIKRILNTDPVARYSIVDIRLHPWMSRIPPLRIPFCEIQSESVLVSSETGDPVVDPTRKKIILDKQILQEVVTHFKVTAQVVADALASGSHNNMTTTYYIFARRKYLDVEMNENCETVTIVANTAPQSRSMDSTQNQACAQEDGRDTSTSSDVRASRDTDPSVGDKAGMTRCTPTKSNKPTIPKLTLSTEIASRLQSQTARTNSTAIRPVSASSACKTARAPAPFNTALIGARIQRGIVPSRKIPARHGSASKGHQRPIGDAQNARPGTCESTLAAFRKLKLQSREADQQHRQSETTRTQSQIPQRPTTVHKREGAHAICARHRAVVRKEK